MSVDRTLPSSEAVAPAAVRYVGFWARVAASMIDSILLLVLLVPFSLILFGDGSIDGPLTSTDPAHFLIDTILPAMVVILFWARRQATPGKIAVHARIVDARTGGPPTTGQLVLRYLGYFVSAFVLCLGFLWVAFDRRKQGWHDKIASTVVVREPDDAFGAAPPPR